MSKRKREAQWAIGDAAPKRAKAASGRAAQPQLHASAFAALADLSDDESTPASIAARPATARSDSAGPPEELSSKQPASTKKDKRAALKLQKKQQKREQRTQSTTSSQPEPTAKTGRQQTKAARKQAQRVAAFVTGRKPSELKQQNKVVKLSDAASSSSKSTPAKVEAAPQPAECDPSSMEDELMTPAPADSKLPKAFDEADDAEMSANVLELTSVFSSNSDGKERSGDGSLISANAQTKRLSTFPFDDKDRVRSNSDGSYSLRMKDGETICFHGVVRIRVESGLARVFGHMLSPESGTHELHSPLWNASALLTIEGMSLGDDEDEFSVINLSVARTNLKQDELSDGGHSPALFHQQSTIALAHFHPLLEVALELSSFGASSAALLSTPFPASSSAWPAPSPSPSPSSSPPHPSSSPDAEADSFFGLSSSSSSSAGAGASTVSISAVVSAADSDSESASASAAQSLRSALRTPRPTRSILSAALAARANAAALVAPVSPVTLSAGWQTLAASLLQLCQDDSKASKGSGGREGAPIVLLCGPRNSGKSTLSRFLVNVLLSGVSSVAFLDCDVGQTEFTPPGLLSLHLVTQPLFGPPHTHLRAPDCAMFYGDVATNSDPIRYLDYVKRLIAHFREKIARAHPRAPLIVNTQGWVKGMGLHLLHEIAAELRPSHIVELDPRVDPTTERPVIRQPAASSLFATANDVSATIWACPVYAGTGVKASTAAAPGALRNAALMSYFAEKSSTTVSMSTIASILAAQPPYKVAWSALTLRIVHAEVPPSEYLHAFNGSVVGLCAPLVDSKAQSSASPSSLSIAAVAASADAKQASELNVPRQLPECTCLGLGIVRSIDPVARVLYLLTPLSPAALAKVTILLKGRLDLPAAFLHLSGATAASQPFGASGASGEQPYLTFASLAAVGSGSAEMKSRRHLPRKRLSQP